MSFLPKNLKELPKLRDSISYFYIEHALLEQSDSSLMIHRGSYFSTYLLNVRAGD